MQKMCLDLLEKNSLERNISLDVEIHGVDDGVEIHLPDKVVLIQLNLITKTTLERFCFLSQFQYALYIMNVKLLPSHNPEQIKGHLSLKNKENLRKYPYLWKYPLLE